VLVALVEVVLVVPAGMVEVDLVDTVEVDPVDPVEVDPVDLVAYPQEHPGFLLLLLHSHYLLSVHNIASHNLAYLKRTRIHNILPPGDAYPDVYN
jgi:hypothetical protein